MSRNDVIRITSEAELKQAFAIRREVFVSEQGICEAIEIDGQDEQALHLLAIVRGQPVGTLRIRRIDDGRIAKIERVAVLQAHRGAGIGVALMEVAIDIARREGATLAKLNAQSTVESFYGGLGFASYGDIFEEDGIPHIAMQLSLDEACEKGG